LKAASAIPKVSSNGWPHGLPFGEPLQRAIGRMKDRHQRLPARRARSDDVARDSRASDALVDI
jgi:hypothetical protein